MKKYLLIPLFITFLLHHTYAQQTLVSPVASGSNYSSIAYDVEGNL